MAVVTEAVTATGALCRGLRQHFSAQARVLLPLVLDKIKEKNPATLKAGDPSLPRLPCLGC